MQIQPDLTVCTVVNDQPLAAKSMLRSLYETADPVALEVIVVDTSGSGKVGGLLNDFPDIKLFEVEEGQSFGEGMNHGIRLAKGRYVGLFDHDLVLMPNSLKILIDFMDDTPDTGLCGPRIVNAFGKTEHTGRSFNTVRSLLAQYTDFGRYIPAGIWRDSFVLGGKEHLTTGEVDWLCTGLHIIRQEVIDEIGELDESYLLGQEEEYYLRAKRAGWHNYYVYDAKIIHPNPLKYMVEPSRGKFSNKMIGCAWHFFKRKWHW